MRFLGGIFTDIFAYGFYRITAMAFPWCVSTNKVIVNVAGRDQHLTWSSCVAPGIEWGCLLQYGWMEGEWAANVPILPSHRYADTMSCIDGTIDPATEAADTLYVFSYVTLSMLMSYLLK